MHTIIQTIKNKFGQNLIRGREKKLPVGTPLITTYTQHAHLLSILMNHECTYPWIMSNYIQLYINKDFKHPWGDFYFPGTYELRPSDTCQWLISQKLHRDLVVKKWGKVIDFVMDSIDSGNYVHTMLNYFYVPICGRYKKLHLHHDIFIYGYNPDKKVLYVSDFFKEGIYTRQELSFSDFETAFSANDQAVNPDWLNKLVYLYRFNAEYAGKYHFSAQAVLNSIESYVSCNKPEYWNIYNFEDDGKNLDFGLEVYSSCINYISNTSGAGGELDIRPFSLLRAHKKMMSLRLTFLSEGGYLNAAGNRTVSEFYDIEARAEKILTAVLKYNITRDKAAIERAAARLSEMKHDESRILTSLVQAAAVTRTTEDGSR